MLSFVLDQNLGLPACDEPWKTTLNEAGIAAHETTDLAAIDKALADHGPDFAYVPTADFYQLLRSGDEHYRGLAIATSKFTGDPASGLDDLAGAEYGYINSSCTSSYFAPAILLTQHGKAWDEFMRFVAVPPWQGQIDAVVTGQVRATMVLEDVWRTKPENAEKTKIIGRYDSCKPPVVIARKGVDEATCTTLFDASVSWVPDWSGVYGALKPVYYADIYGFFHDLDQLSVR